MQSVRNAENIFRSCPYLRHERVRRSGVIALLTLNHGIRQTGSLSVLRHNRCAEGEIPMISTKYEAWGQREKYLVPNGIQNHISGTIHQMSSHGSLYFVRENHLTSYLQTQH